MSVCQLKEAFSRRDTARLEQLLDSGADIDTDLDGTTPDSPNYGGRRTMLHLAAAAGDIEMIAWLVAHKANMNAWYGWPGIAPLHLSARAGHCEAIETLAKHGANLESYNIDDGGGTALDIALSVNRVAAAKTLLRLGATINVAGERHGCDSLTGAILCNDAELVIRVIEKGADVNRLDQEETPLYTVAEVGNVEMAALLVAHGALLNPVNAWPPVVGAIQGGHVDMIRYLISQGAKVPPEHTEVVSRLLSTT